jgi:hypothetical protein
MEETRANDGMKYIGDGSTLVGVPPRDLTAEEVGEYGKQLLLESGLYAEFRKAYAPKPTKSALKGGSAEKTEE